MQDYNLDRTVGVGGGFFGCVSHRVVIFDTSILILLSVLLLVLFFFQRFFLSPYLPFSYSLAKFLTPAWPSLLRLPQLPSCSLAIISKRETFPETYY